MSISSVGSYQSTLEAYKPAQFVADTALPNSGAPKVTPLSAGELGQLADQSAMESGAATEAPGFGEMVKSFVGDVNDKMETADKQTKDYMVGKTHDTGAVVSSVEEANLSFQFALAIRNKLVTAYQSVSAIQY